MSETIWKWTISQTSNHINYFYAVVNTWVKLSFVCLVFRQCKFYIWKPKYMCYKNSCGFCAWRTGIYITGIYILNALYHRYHSYLCFWFYLQWSIGWQRCIETIYFSQIKTFGNLIIWLLMLWNTRHSSLDSHTQSFSPLTLLCVLGTGFPRHSHFSWFISGMCWQKIRVQKERPRLFFLLTPCWLIGCEVLFLWVKPQLLAGGSSLYPQLFSEI